jgi:hypothetical protein
LLKASGIAFLLCSSLRATSIVAFWTPAAIVVAADSKASVGGRLGSRESQTCKIRPVGPYYFAATGLTNVPETGFDLNAIFSTVATADRSISAIADEMASTAREKLFPALEFLRNRYPQNYAADFGERSGGIALAFVVFGSEDGQPRMAVRQIGAPGFPSNDKRVDYPGAAAMQFGAAYAGQNDALARFIAANPDWRQKYSLQDAAKMFVELEANRTDLGSRNTVGLPLSRLEVTGRGAAWIEPGVCNPTR